jgi:hypothetical protein
VIKVESFSVYFSSLIDLLAFPDSKINIKAQLQQSSRLMITPSANGRILESPQLNDHQQQRLENFTRLCSSLLIINSSQWLFIDHFQNDRLSGFAINSTIIIVGISHACLPRPELSRELDITHTNQHGAPERIKLFSSLRLVPHHVLLGLSLQRLFSIVRSNSTILIVEAYMCTEWNVVECDLNLDCPLVCHSSSKSSA